MKQVSNVKIDIDYLSISKDNLAYYNPKTKELYFHGWILPKNSYDKINVWYKDIYLGSSKLYVNRPDVL